MNRGSALIVSLIAAAGIYSCQEKRLPITQQPSAGQAEASEMEVRHDIGEANEGELLRFEFPIAWKSQGEGEVLLRPSCGCTEVELVDLHREGADSVVFAGTVRGAFNTANKPGNQVLNVWLINNDSGKLLKVVTLECKVRRTLMAELGSQVFTLSAPGDESVTSIEVSSTIGSAIQGIESGLVAADRGIEILIEDWTYEGVGAGALHRWQATVVVRATSDIENEPGWREMAIVLNGENVGVVATVPLWADVTLGGLQSVFIRPSYAQSEIALKLESHFFHSPSAAYIQTPAGQRIELMPEEENSGLDSSRAAEWVGVWPEGGVVVGSEVIVVSSTGAEQRCYLSSIRPD